VKQKIGIIDIEMGNLYSIEKSLKYFDENFTITSNVNLLRKCHKFILPGVGAFGKAMKIIKKKKLDELIYKQIKEGKFILGICLGMQILGKKSFEFGENSGLKLNDLVFKPFKKNINKIDFHIGFNEVKYSQNSRLFKDINQNSDFYFLHAFHAKPLNDSFDYSYSNYKGKFVSAYEKKNIFGVQFHPEKSQINGLKLIKNFLKL